MQDEVGAPLFCLFVSVSVVGILAVLLSFWILLVAILDQFEIPRAQELQALHHLWLCPCNWDSYKWYTRVALLLEGGR